MKEELRKLPSLPGPLPVFDTEVLPDDPNELFVSWLRDAIDSGIREPHAMVVSTVGEDGAPDARVLILKNVDARGWHFATVDAGPKGRQIAQNPNVALTFYWSPLGRQVRIRGVAAKADRGERDADFLARSIDARANVLVGRQSQPLTSVKDLDGALAEQALRIAEQPDMIADHWSLFVVAAHAVEFWQGAEDRRHSRVSYTLRQDVWSHTRLWP
ncbi:pyridoxine/pyridoxamine 5'-phosphate oxidase [Neorhizobium alkalisoli]|uniref:Pyridoxamine 5'-phosphate oxidase n=1 Tax=Neorhizobium alkalisoli TaxID=528178 RepID=A0A561Q0Y9_9HYPH|nr:pyridoxal 5'-phosphate synthase [Neorhizobium alkalisoli]TWF43999.1 pyridoxamine 5'-phosphate oxidase [Neorhizobium alkalisoli]